MDAAKQNPPPLCVFMVYDLPNRDCHALASNGEICCAYKGDGTCDYDNSGDCSDGLAEYRTTYIDPFAEVSERQGLLEFDRGVCSSSDDSPRRRWSPGFSVVARIYRESVGDGKDRCSQSLTASCPWPS